MKNFDNRADAEVVGHVIVLGITILGVSMIALYGIPAISSLQDMANLKSTEQAFTVLDSRASRSALGEAPRQITDIALGGGYISTIPNSSSNPSYILIEINSTPTIPSIYIPMGKIVYKLGEREVAYEGGGVWSKYPSASIMLSPPEFHYNGETLTLPVVNITGNYSMGGKGTAALNIEKKGKPRVIYPNTTLNPNFTNPIPENATYVNITINSTYYDGWASYFRSIPLTNIYTDANEKKVTVKLQTPLKSTSFSYGALASDEIVLKNTAKVDSYNSSGGQNYSQTKSGNGSIRANNKVKLDNPQVNVSGNVMSGGNVEGRGTVTKDAYGSPISGTLNVKGTKYPAVEKISVPSATETVNDMINQTKADLPNEDLNDCLKDSDSNKTLDDSSGGFSGGTCTLLAGNYYLTKINLGNNSKSLIFNTTSGPINIAVDSDDIKIDTDAYINVTGSNPVKLYLGLNSGAEIEIKKAKINRNTSDNSTLFQITASRGKEIKFKGAIFTGSLYAPDAKIMIETTTQVYGAMVGKKFEVEQSEYIHFDEAQKTVSTGLGEGTTIMYLYITRNDLGVSIS